MTFTDGLLLFYVAIILGCVWFLWWSQRRLMRVWHELIQAQVQVIAGQSQTILALTRRLSPTGHVDLSPEEMKAEGDIQLFRNEDGGLRILAK